MFYLVIAVQSIVCSYMESLDFSQRNVLKRKHDEDDCKSVDLDKIFSHKNVAKKLFYSQSTSTSDDSDNDNIDSATNDLSIRDNTVKYQYGDSSEDLYVFLSVTDDLKTIDFDVEEFVIEEMPSKRLRTDTPAPKKNTSSEKIKVDDNVSNLSEESSTNDLSIRDNTVKHQCENSSENLSVFLQVNEALKTIDFDSEMFVIEETPSKRLRTDTPAPKKNTSSEKIKVDDNVSNLSEESSTNDLSIRDNTVKHQCENSSENLSVFLQVNEALKTIDFDSEMFVIEETPSKRLRTDTPAPKKNTSSEKFKVDDNVSNLSEESSTNDLSIRDNTVKHQCENSPEDFVFLSVTDDLKQVDFYLEEFIIEETPSKRLRTDTPAPRNNTSSEKFKVDDNVSNLSEFDEFIYSSIDLGDSNLDLKNNVEQP